MNRRDFSKTVGFSFLFSAGVMTKYQEPSVAVQFDLSDIPNKPPDNVDNLVVSFSEISGEFQAINESVDATVILGVSVDGKSNKKVFNNLSVSNGSIDILDKISENNLKIDLTDVNDEFAQGSLSVRVEHPSVSETFTRSFTLTGPGVPDKKVIDSGGSWSLDVQQFTDTIPIEVRGAPGGEGGGGGGGASLGESPGDGGKGGGVLIELDLAGIQEINGIVGFAGGDGSDGSGGNGGFGGTSGSDGQSEFYDTGPGGAGTGGAYGGEDGGVGTYAGSGEDGDDAGVDTENIDQMTVIRGSSQPTFEGSGEVVINPE